MIQIRSLGELLVVTVLVIIIFRKLFSGKGKGFMQLLGTILKGLFKVLGMIIQIVIKILEELLKLIAILIKRIFQLLVRIFSWIKNLF